MKFNSTQIIIALFVIAVSGAGLFTSSSWLQVNIWGSSTLSNSELSEDFTQLRQNFDSSMNSFLTSAQPGDFDPDNCVPQIPITSLIPISEKAWGRDSQTIAIITKFQQISGDDSDDVFLQKQKFIEPYLTGSDLIPFALYRVFLEDYFLEYTEKLILLETEKEAKTSDPDTSISTSLSKVLQDSQDLSSQITQEISLSESAMDAAFEFLKSEHQAATMITGTCKLLDESDLLRNSFSSERELLQPILEQLAPQYQKTSS